MNATNPVEARKVLTGSMKSCPTCNHLCSNNAKRCPGCGHQWNSRALPIIVGIILVVLFPFSPPIIDVALFITGAVLVGIGVFRK